MALPGSNGMVLVEYVGGKAGTMTFIGPVTNARYLFGGNRVVGYVDAEDAEEFVNMLQNRKPVFRYYQAPVKEKVIKRFIEVKEEAPEAVPVDDVEVTEEIEAFEEVKDPADMTIGKLKDYVEGLTSIDELELLLEAEKTGKNRKGAVEAIEAALHVD